MQAIVYAEVETLSFKQLDALNSVPKGTSFRVFKHVRDDLVEGEDYFYLPADEHRAYIEALRAAGAIYAGTENLVLITRKGYAKMGRAG